jgi:hypothetical protein
MQKPRLAICTYAILVAAFPGYSLCQSERVEQSLKGSECVVGVGQFAQTSRTSPDVIRLQSELLDPDVPVTLQLILQLADKSARDVGLSRPQPVTTLAERRMAKLYARYEHESTGKYLDILVEALPQKRGAAQVESLKIAVGDQTLRLTPMRPEVQDCFQRAMADIFPSLPFETQWPILDSGSYQLFKSANLTAYLRQLYDSLEDHVRGSSPEEVEEDLRFYRTIILRRIYEDDPTIGRAMILDEIMLVKPRADIEALSVLPDDTLPEMDRILLQQLPGLHNNSDDFEVMARLGIVARYATISLLPGVKSAYVKDAGKWRSDQVGLFLSYFLRTDLQFAKRLIAKRLKERPNELLFTDIAHIRVSPELGEIAKDYIDYPDRKIGANAAYIFKWLGDADVEAALWTNLDTWHKKWSANSGSIPVDEQNYQDSLVEALLLGGGPCKSKDTMDRLRPLYIKGNSTDGNIEFPEWHDPVTIVVDAHSPSGPEFHVDFCSGSLGLEQLRTAIPRFPKGTNFEWGGVYDPTLDDTLDPAFTELESLAKAHGMSLRLHQYQ